MEKLLMIGSELKMRSCVRAGTNLRESEEAATRRAGIPSSYEANQLHVSVEAGQLMVNGEREVEVSYWDGEQTRTEPRLQRIFRVHELPAEIDPSRATAVLKSDVLT